jgi:hypothetical protein
MLSARPGAPQSGRYPVTGKPSTDAAVPSAGAIVAVLIALQAEYCAWFDALPENLQESAPGEALQAIVDLDLDEIVAIEPPRGFGRD